MGKGLVGSLLARYLPTFRSEPLQPDDFKAVYIPVWFMDGEVTGNITKSDTEVRGVETVQKGYDFYDWLGVYDCSFVKLVRMVYWAQVFAVADARLRALGICLVGSTIVTSFV